MATRRKVKTRPLDVAEYLESEQDLQGLLEVAFESGDTAHIARTLGVAARARGMLKLSQETGLGREQLYRTLSADGNPTLDTLLKVSKALGLQLTLKAA